MTRPNTGNWTSPDTGRRPVLRSVFLPLIAVLCVVTLVLVVSGLAAKVIDEVNLTVASGARQSEAINLAVKPSEPLYLISWLDHGDYPSTGRVRVINRSTGEVVHTLDTGSAPDIAVSPDAQRLYLAAIEYTEYTIGGKSVWKDYLTAFDTGTWATIWKTEIERPADSNGRYGNRSGTGPSALTISPAGSRLLIQKQAGWDAWFTMLDSGTGQVAVESPRLAKCIRASLTFSPDGHEIYLSCPANDTLHFLDAATLQVKESLHIPGQPMVSALSGDGLWLYVVTYGGRVALVNLEKRTIEQSVDANSESSPVRWGSVTFSVDSSRLFAAGSDSSQDVIRIFDTRSWEHMGTAHLSPLDLEGGLVQLGVSRDQNHLLLLLRNEYIENDLLHVRTAFSTLDLTHTDAISTLKLDLADNEQLVRFVIGP